MHPRRVLATRQQLLQMHRAFDAMAGRATALERLGRAKEARGAWASLVELYPASAYASHARARMEALDDR